MLGRIPASDLNGWCVKFGAWDGIHMSNTFNMVENHGYSDIYIEGNPKYFDMLKVTAVREPNIHPILEMVSSRNDAKSLDAIL